MERAETHATELGATRLILDVLASGVAVIEWYKRLGYTEIAPHGGELPTPMVYLAKPRATRAGLLARPQRIKRSLAEPR